MNFNKIFEKNVTYTDIKSDQKTKPYTIFRQNIFYIYSRVKVWIFLNETSVLDFAELAIFHLCLNKNKLRINCLENP